MKSLELFSGAGGLARGLEEAGFTHVGFVENNAHACNTLRANFNPKLIHAGDIRNFDFSTVGPVDLVAGGPPCQPFSLGGKHLGNTDLRDMFPYAIRAIENLVPQAFIFENVKGLLRESFAEYFEYILLRLQMPHLGIDTGADWKTHLNRLRDASRNQYDGVKYNVSAKLINAADFGVPQVRERVVMVGIRSDLDRSWVWPNRTHSMERLLWDQRVGGEYWDRNNVPLSERLGGPGQKLPKRHLERLTTGLFAPEGAPWLTIRDAFQGIGEPKDGIHRGEHRFRAGAKSYPGHTGSPVDWPSKTIKAGGHGVPGGENTVVFGDGSLRYLTVFEAKILQSFEPDFVVTGAWGEAMRQIGNAVPPQLARVLGRQLISILNVDETLLS
jgi:DNA (cytosine-5)-methyltransferase 1